jgi:hypothetical protein
MLRSCTLPQGPGAGFGPCAFSVWRTLASLFARPGGLAPRKWGGQKGGLHEDGLSSVRWQVCFHGHVYG